MGFNKYSMLVLLAVVLLAFRWRFGRAVFKGVTKWLLWALAALCAGAGVIAMLGSEGKRLPVLGRLLPCLFAVYLVKVAESSRKRS